MGKLIEIVDDYPASDLAVKLISGQRIGAISLDGIRIKAENAAAWARERPEREARQARDKAESEPDQRVA